MPIGRPEELFRQFLTSNGDINAIVGLFKQLCDELLPCSSNIESRRPGIDLCRKICGGISCFESRTLLECLTSRSSHVEYDGGRACRNMKVLIVGAGPCGLRLAIECALLGAESVNVIEMRSYLSRNNGLHLWPFVMDDLRRIGAKVFYPRFGSGSIDHISTKRLQELLLKIALLLGVEVHAPVQFRGLVEPDPITGCGWKICCEGDQCLGKLEFDVIIGAAGAKHDIIPGFKRKRFRAKMAIAVTANFVNNCTTRESRVPEISGISFIYHQDFFKELKQTVGIDLENIVYYKGDTHYFVMTPKKSCLLAKGVLKQDHPDPAILLAQENVDHAALKAFAREAADASTRHQLPAESLQFAKTHRDEDDVAVFDFTALHQAEYASRVCVKHGRMLLLGIVGDTLLEPFWPIGSGVARGFLGVLDTAWLIRNWAIRQKQPVELIVERESVFQLLSQTTPENLKKNVAEYTINPVTRYGTRLNLDAIPIQQALRQFDTDSTVSIDIKDTAGAKRKSLSGETASDKPLKKAHVDEKSLLLWYQDLLSDFSDVAPINDLYGSWENALAFCALVQVFRPKLINVRRLDAKNVEANATLAFSLIEQEFHVEPRISAKELTRKQQDPLETITYLFFVYQAVKDEVALLGKSIPTAASESNGASSAAETLSASKKLRSIQNVEDGTRRITSLMSTLRAFQKTVFHAKSQDAGKQHRRANRKRRQMTEALSRTTTQKDDHSSEIHRVKKQDSLKRSGVRKHRNSIKKSVLYNDTSAGASSSGHRQSSENSVEKSNESQMVRIHLTNSFQSSLQPKSVKRSISVKTFASANPNQPSSDKKAIESENDPTAAEATAENTSAICEQRGIVTAVLSKFERIDINSNDKKCFTCSKPLYMIDKVTAHGYWFHSSCLRCNECNCRLRIGASMMKKEDDNTVKIYCETHAFRVGGLFDVKWNRQSLVSESIADSHQDQVDAGNFENNVDQTPATTVADAAAAKSESVSDDEVLQVNHPPVAESNEESLSGSEDGDEDEIEEGNDQLDELKNTCIWQMMLADELQDAMEAVAAVRAEEDQIDQRARELENIIRQQKSRLSDTDELTSDWLSTLEVKIALIERESQFLLRARLTELKTRHADLSLQLNITSKFQGDKFQQLEDEMNQLTEQIVDLQEFLGLHETLTVE